MILQMKLFLSLESVALASQTAFPILLELLKNKRVINILANLQAYFNNRRYFPILMLKFDSDSACCTFFKFRAQCVWDKKNHYLITWCFSCLPSYTFCTLWFIYIFAISFLINTSVKLSFRCYCNKSYCSQFVIRTEWIPSSKIWKI